MKAILLSATGAVLVALAAGPTVTPGIVVVPSTSERMAPMVLNGYSRYPRKIGTASVYDMDGHPVGLVQKLEADPMGKPIAMTIWLSSGRPLRVEAPNIGYDEQQNTVTIGLTDGELGIPQRAPVKKQ